MALARPEFSKLFEQESKQQDVRKLAEEHVHKSAIIHQAFYLGLKDRWDFPGDLVELRKISAELDHCIMSLLSRTERKRVVELLEKSPSLGNLRLTPPVRYSVNGEDYANQYYE